MENNIDGGVTQKKFDKSFSLILCISLLSMISIAVCLLSISFIQTRFLIFLINTSVMLAFLDLSFVIFFAVMIFHPQNYIFVMGGLIVNKQDNKSNTLESFLSSYKELEHLLSRIEKYLVGSNAIPSNRRHSRIFIADSLMRKELINVELRNKLVDIITVRNYVVHEVGVFASQKAYDLIKELLPKLEDVAQNLYKQNDVPKV